MPLIEIRDAAGTLLAGGNDLSRVIQDVVDLAVHYRECLVDLDEQLKEAAIRAPDISATAPEHVAVFSAGYEACQRRIPQVPLDVLPPKKEANATTQRVPVDLRWEWHTEHHGSLMLGRIEVAQVSKYETSHHWNYSLKFTVDGEKSTFSKQSREEAMAVVESHAINVMKQG